MSCESIEECVAYAHMSLTSCGTAQIAIMPVRMFVDLPCMLQYKCMFVNECEIK